MVYKTLSRLKSPARLKGPCEKIRSANRPISTGASIEQKPWKPTVRKGLISAEHIPGRPSYKTIPVYLGPNVVDSKKKSAPAFSFGKRITRKSDTTTIDSLAKYNIRGLCNKGRCTAPAFTLQDRRRDIKSLQLPSANRYSTINAYKSTTKAAPKFSFGKIPAVMKTLPTPAANVYNLPPVFGTAKESQIKAAPAFSMLSRVKPRQIPAPIFPGPGEYENNYRYLNKQSPRFTLRSKHKIMTDEHIKPSPAAYCPERYYKHKSVPAPSFSIQHTPYLGVRKAHLIPEYKSSFKPDWILQKCSVKTPC